jgi:phosphoglycolate phosphatase-like HAD superfamily hydrolase
MAKRNTLVRRLSWVERLGETTVICTDKTGTLTENQMTVQRVWTANGEYSVEGAGYELFGRFRADGKVVEPAPLTELLRAGLLCNDARIANKDHTWSAFGDPTEAALVVLAEKGGLHHRKEAARAPRQLELPFSSERKRMTTVHLVAGRRVAYGKGAAEMILPRTTLSEEAQAEVVAAEEAMEHDALRVLAFARRALRDDTGDDPDVIKHELEFLGLIGMLDPPRPEVPEAIRRCRNAGIRIIMVTGDSGRTAEAIARQIGLNRGRGACDHRAAAGRHGRRGAASPAERTRRHLRPHRPRAEASAGERPTRSRACREVGRTGGRLGGHTGRRRARRAAPRRYPRPRAPRSLLLVGLRHRRAVGVLRGIRLPAGGVVVMAYFTGTLANVLPLPGGLGGVEGGMIGALLAFDVGSGLAVTAALGYRAFEYWLPIIPGVLAYLRLVRTVRGWERQDERTGDAAARTV